MFSGGQPPAATAGLQADRRAGVWAGRQGPHLCQAQGQLDPLRLHLLYRLTQLLAVLHTLRTAMCVRSIHQKHPHHGQTARPVLHDLAGTETNRCPPCGQDSGCQQSVATGQSPPCHYGPTLRCETVPQARSMRSTMRSRGSIRPCRGGSPSAFSRGDPRTEGEISLRGICQRRCAPGRVSTEGSQHQLRRSRPPGKT